LTIELRNWLTERAAELRDDALRRAPNLLPDAVGVDSLLTALGECLDRAMGSQLTVVQSWVLNEIGPDAAAAHDWLVLFRTLKDALGDWLFKDFPPAQAFRHWRDLDQIFNYLFMETTRLATDPDRQTLLSHMVDLRRQMERLDRTKVSFVSVAAHELKTPLTVMEGYVDMLRASLPSEQAHLGLYLDGFENGAERMRQIVSDMLDAAAIDANMLKIAFQPVYLEKILQGVVANLQAAFHERNIALILEPLVYREMIFGDPERLTQAFYKIVINGLKYTPDGGKITITNRLTRPAEVSKRVAGFIDVTITDTGIGIDPEELDGIFEKFSRTTAVATHSTGKTKFKGGGPGLGLPISRGIIKAHGGRVWAESPGCNEETCPGSSFHVELPLLLQPPRADKTPF
jgi:signal transduction histidine kinase